MLFKIGYYLLENVRNRSSMVNYAIPFNLICGVLTLMFIYLKFNELKTKKSVDAGDSVENKKFHT